MNSKSIFLLKKRLILISLLILIGFFVPLYFICQVPKSERCVPPALCDIKLKEPYSSTEYHLSVGEDLIINHNVYERWIFKLMAKPSSNSGRLHPKSTRMEIDLSLKIRKLILNVVRYVNKVLLKNESYCSQIWSNPISIQHLQHFQYKNGSSLYKINFNVEPGGILLKANVLVTSPSREEYPYEPEILQVLKSKLIMDDWNMSTNPSKCDNIPAHLLHLCICLKDKELIEKLKNKTKKWRNRRSNQDPEMSSWPPNASFFIEDYITYNDYKDFIRFPTNPKFICDGTKILMLIHSKVSHFKIRAAIRNTFGNSIFLKNLKTKVIFAVGRAQDSKDQIQIIKESKKYNDILQGSYFDSYHNLTLKILSSLNWINYVCNDYMPDWILKADDDYMINVKVALKIINENPSAELIGIKACKQFTNRDESYMPIYYMPKYMYEADYYPGYVSGAAWMLRSDVIPGLLKASLTVPLIHVDDVYVTGLLTREIGIIPRSTPLITYIRDPDECKIKTMMSLNIENSKDLQAHWKKLLKPDNFCKINESLLEVTKITEKDKKECYY